MPEPARPTRKEVFSVYNQVKAAARKAGDVQQVDRINKALGMLLSGKGAKAEYKSSCLCCLCADYSYRRGYSGPCKHMIAEVMFHLVRYKRGVLTADLLKLLTNPPSNITPYVKQMIDNF